MEQIVQPSENQSPEFTSLTNRITNVFASPGELLDELKANPVRSSSWVVPLLLSMFLGIFMVTAMYYNEILREQIYDMQSEKIYENVEKGKMSDEQADQYTEGMRKSGPIMFIAIGGISAAVMVALIFFGVSLILFLIMKLGLKFSLGYTKVLELYGLVSMISIFGGVITMLLMYFFDSMFASPGLGLIFVNDFDVNNKLHSLMSQINIFTLWQYGLLGFGLAKLTDKSTRTGLTITYGLWILWVIVSVLGGIGLR